MAKNYESENKNTKNYTDTSDKNCFRNESNRTDNLKTTNAMNHKNKTNDKTSQSYDEEDTYRY